MQNLNAGTIPSWENLCCDDVLWSDLGAAIDIPCYFGSKSNLLDLLKNNMEVYGSP